ncbi:MAG TPA: molybdate ABC transporter substrate-binding protein [Anaerolineales bacterium]|nr:molybdate ABC transporter substrate-binding protein [Anaerolineales bacterium]
MNVKPRAGGARSPQYGPTVATTECVCYIRAAPKMHAGTLMRAHRRTTVASPTSLLRRTAIVVILVMTACTPAPPQPALLIAAASSLSPAFDEIGQSLATAGGPQVVFTYGASVDLAEQMRNGAPFDILASADPALIDELIRDGAAEPSSERVFAAGELGLALIPEAIDLGAKDLSILTSPSIRAIAVASPEHAPYGRAARQALEASGLWQTVSEKVVFGSSAEHALNFLQTGNAQAGLLPISLLLGTTLAWQAVPEGLYDPPAYSAVMRIGVTNAEGAQRFLAFLVSDDGRAILRSHGLTPSSGP